MAVAPVPVTILFPVVLPVVFTIALVTFHEVTPVSVVFAVIPVVVVTVVAIIDAKLNFLRPGSGHDYDWCGNGGSQNDGIDVTIDVAH
jgi:hypothetical protein